MSHQLSEEIRILGKEIQAIKPDEELDLNNELMIIEKARTIVMDTFYDKDWGAHKWLMDTHPDLEQQKIRFARYVDSVLKNRELKKVAHRMLKMGFEVNEIERITELPISLINQLKDQELD